MGYAGTITMNTSANMILLRKGSIWKSTGPPNNSGAGTVIQKGTSLAGAFTFNTTGYGPATDEMTLTIDVL